MCVFVVCMLFYNVFAYELFFSFADIISSFFATPSAARAGIRLADAQASGNVKVNSQLQQHSGSIGIDRKKHAPSRSPPPRRASPPHRSASPPRRSASPPRRSASPKHSRSRSRSAPTKGRSAVGKKGRSPIRGGGKAGGRPVVQPQPQPNAEDLENEQPEAEGDDGAGSEDGGGIEDGGVEEGEDGADDASDE